METERIRKTSNMKSAITKRMKENYEMRTRTYLPRRTYTIIRIDGKAFHTLTKNFEKPFDNRLIYAMNAAALKLCKEIQGVQFAYTQSDEISLLLTDFEKPETDAWFDGQVQKICSVSASIATVGFNLEFPEVEEQACFDSRCFTIPDWIEVYNYFVDRNNDCARNSIAMVAQSLYSHNELIGKNSGQKQEMIFQKGINWSEYEMGLKNGRLNCQAKLCTH